MFDWITGFVRQAGYVGVALLMLLENVIPPIRVSRNRTDRVPATPGRYNITCAKNATR